MTKSLSHLWRILRLTPLFLAAGCSPSGMVNEYKVQENLQAAAQKAVLNDTPQARVWTDRAIAVNPTDITTYVGPATTDPDNPKYSIATIFTETGDDRTLIYYMRQAIAKSKSDYRPLQVLAAAEGRIGDITDQQKDATALAALLEKKLITPRTKIDANLYATLAQAYCDAGNEVQGRAAYQRALSAYPDDPDVLNGLAYHYAVVNSKPDLAAGLVMAQKALKLRQAGSEEEEVIALYSAEIQDTIGWIQYRQGNYKDALDSVQAAVTIDPREAEVRYHLGMIDLALGRKVDAANEFKHSVTINQDYAAAQTELATLQSSPKQTL